MVGNILVNIKKIKNKEKDNFFGLMEANTLEIGFRGNSMEEEFIYQVLGKQSKDNGIMANE